MSMSMWRVLIFHECRAMYGYDGMCWLIVDVSVLTLGGVTVIEIRARRNVEVFSSEKSVGVV